MWEIGLKRCLQPSTRGCILWSFQHHALTHQLLLLQCTDFYSVFDDKIVDINSLVRLINSFPEEFSLGGGGLLNAASVNYFLARLLNIYNKSKYMLQ